MIITLKNYPDIGRLKVVSDMNEDPSQPCARCVLYSRKYDRQCVEMFSYCNTNRKLFIQEDKNDQIKKNT